MDTTDQGGLARPDRHWQTDMVEAVLSSGVFADPHQRELLIWLTGDALGRDLALNRTASAMLQCVEIVRACAREPGGLRILAEAIRALEPGTEATRRVAGLVDERDSEPRNQRSGSAAESATVARNDRGRKDFFISYTSADRRWAVWIAWELEEAGFGVLVQEWDFVPGSNWHTGMERGVTEYERTIAVLSPDYLKSVYGRQEWQVAVGADPAGFKRKLVPVRIASCTPQGLLASVVFIDLVGLTSEQAHRQLLAGIGGANSGRSKPTAPPLFPSEGNREQLDLKHP
ncbi:toll/interleukin-1 receptor domain-containing protein [Streptomyces turgidiscabies]|uniref:TIR domain-containing protein n=1 Tax=Streptomyces turgidiscabies (strain Car8) TaxID=698760 RepID=L7EWK9_STRT8|nr:MULTISPECIES: toll/interleukin-1 receptor domain-containing protein [Streptomyces]ELP63803.1 hypothetical protein STRTUCAR8_06518 [Streptomyces turgidiscabies Car8]MDX3493344.1 toll/interleukin-1 receptor domain-containing protein [Streptomyces turgidiscabies]GAQ70648.1 hypothetical protein T45_02385 [Streptomyces turgidiscabies]